MSRPLPACPRLPRTALALLVVATAPGCPALPDLEAEPAIEIGTGEFQFEPLTDETELPLIYGIQGGYHVWGAVRATGIDWRRAITTFSLTDADGVLLASDAPFLTRYMGAEDGWGEFIGAALIVDDPAEVRQTDATLNVQVIDDEGRSAEATGEVRISSEVIEQGSG